jgi:hypothetical protein
MWRGSSEQPNKELKLTKPGPIGASQLNSSVGQTVRGSTMPERLAAGLLVAIAAGCLREAPPRVYVDLITVPTKLTQIPTVLEPDKPLPADNDSVSVCIIPGQGYSLTDHWTVRTPEGSEARIAAHAELTDDSLTTLSSPSLAADTICYHPAPDGPLPAQMRRVRLIASQPIVAKRILWSSTAP